MRRMIFRIVITFLTIASCGSLFALQKVTGKIDAVTIYTDRALVKRTIGIDAAAKNGTLRFTGLPQSLMTDSVRANGKGVNITGVALRYVEKVAGDEWADHPLKKKLIKIEAQIRAENDALTNYREQLRVVDTMMRLTTNQSDREARANALNVDSWQKALAFLEEKRSGYQEKIRESDEKLDKLRKEQSRLSIRFNADVQVAKLSATEVEVSYVRATESAAKVELEYLVNNVSWTSVYDLRGSAEGSEFQLVSHAIIRQNTGENWPDAVVTLSTARPATSVSPGILQPWRVDASSLFSNRMNKGDSGRANAREDALESVSESSGVSESGDSTTVSITLPGRENILSDNSDHRVTLSTASLKATLAHVAVPSLSNYVYLKARIKNSSPAPVQGTMNAFLDGNFVGAITLKNSAAVGEEFDVFLGADQRMQLKRTLKRGDIEKSGLFGGKIDVVNQWEIEVANFTKRTKEISVYDQYPIPADPNIATKYIGASRAETSKDANGILVWKVELKSGEKAKFDFSYSLTFPKETWENLARSVEAKEPHPEAQYYQKNAPAAAPQQRQYNLEKMMRKH